MDTKIQTKLEVLLTLTFFCLSFHFFFKVSNEYVGHNVTSPIRRVILELFTNEPDPCTIEIEDDEREMMLNAARKVLHPAYPFKRPSCDMRFMQNPIHWIESVGNTYSHI